MATQNELVPPRGAKRRRKRVGRGLGSGHGRYSGRGIKGQKARSGGGVSPHFEGGQLPLVKRLPARRGFNNVFKTEYSVVNVGELNRFEAGSVVDRDRLLEARLVRRGKRPIKVLGAGELDRRLIVRADRFSEGARKKIEAVGGSVEEVASAPKAS
ncbi:MAG: 50S ribosomal protein L15 [Chloroflexi bacterium]|nr:MAG: 50S ribosomal protein L15 [Chloroflexota bacterium]